MALRQIASPLPSVHRVKLPASAAFSPDQRPVRPVRSDSASRIGIQVKAQRLAAGMSGAALALAAGVSRSMLSRIEHGLVSPSVETLDLIAEGLSIPVARFFGDEDKRTDFCHVRAGGGLVIERVAAVSSYRYELLGHSLSGNLFVEPYLVSLLPDARPYVTFQHPGRKFLYFLSGQVAYRYGSRTAEVKAGDSLFFDANALHGIDKIHTGPVSYLSIVFTVRQ